MKTYQGLFLENQGQILALTFFYVPYPLDSILIVLVWSTDVNTTLLSINIGEHQTAVERIWHRQDSQGHDLGVQF